LRVPVLSSASPVKRHGLFNQCPFSRPIASNDLFRYNRSTEEINIYELRQPTGIEGTGR
jgi:hypothetical protein